MADSADWQTQDSRTWQTGRLKTRHVTNSKDSADVADLADSELGRRDRRDRLKTWHMWHTMQTHETVTCRKANILYRKDMFLVEKLVTVSTAEVIAEVTAEVTAEVLPKSKCE